MNERPPRHLIREGPEVQEHLANPDLERNFVRLCESINVNQITTWEDLIFYFHLFMRRLRRGGTEGYDSEIFGEMMMTNHHQEHRQEQEEHARESELSLFG